MDSKRRKDHIWLRKCGKAPWRRYLDWPSSMVRFFFMFIGFYPHHLPFMSQATESSENYSNQSSPKSICSAVYSSDLILILWKLSRLLGKKVLMCFTETSQTSQPQLKYTPQIREAPGSPPWLSTWYFHSTKWAWLQILLFPAMGFYEISWKNIDKKFWICG